jgi:hypothetical protein
VTRYRVTARNEDKRHPRESGDPELPHVLIAWIPAFAGMTIDEFRHCERSEAIQCVRGLDCFVGP